MVIEPAQAGDFSEIWGILEPVIRAGETYTLPRDFSDAQALGYWFGAGHEVFVARDEGRVVGTFYLKANQMGGGAHVANCGYMVAESAAGRGVARAMCAFSLERARERGFTAMQFNFVVSTNERAVRLWERFEFKVVGRVPAAFAHPEAGLVDALVMHRVL
jgi:L-amino acid N-acyltransferase YncA